VNALELKISKMIYRTEQLSGRTIGDTTSLFGAGILSFVCLMGTQPSKRAKHCKQQIVKHIAEVKTPHLWRLAQARRLFLCVLSTTEGAHATSLREISTGLNSLHMEQLAQGQNILEILEHLKGSDASAKDDGEHDYEK